MCTRMHGRPRLLTCASLCLLAALLLSPSTIRLDGTFCTVGLPEEPMQINAFSLLGAQVNFTASGIGSLDEIKAMLAFADKHNVRPVIQRRPMAEANEGIASVRDGSVRFRVVLENPAK
jgi:D-arabinose 1-dehydrogenase-like Zn-dependent alcohol dehydrogenase